MKNKEVISGIFGGAFFAATYLLVGIPILPAVIAGGAAFAGAELLMSKTKIFVFDKVDEKNFLQVLEDARNKNKYIISMVDKIDDDEIKKYIKEINATTTKIINTVEKNKNKMKQSEKFFTYYLPATVGIITKYDEIENQKLSSSDAKKFFASALDSLKEIDSSFKKILNNLYERDIENATADIKVLNNLLKSEGFNEIEVKEEEKNE